MCRHGKRSFAIRLFLVALAATIGGSTARAEPTVGLIYSDSGASEGLNLFGPQDNSGVYLIDNHGLLVNAWETGLEPRSMVYLLPDGSIMRATVRGAASAGLGVKLQRHDWDGNLIWEFTMDNSVYNQHHDIAVLPNGNVLFIARQLKSVAEAIAAGRDPANLTSDTVRSESVVEIQPILPDDGIVVWSWNVWDHLIQDFDVTKPNHGVVADHPELIDLNYGPSDSDWLHANSVEYDEERDQIVISVRKFNEFWVIDHSTTTAEAASHSGGNSGKGGGLLYRWGNPEAYDRGDAAHTQLYGQHDARRIPAGLPGAGNFTVFNNGWLMPLPAFSRIDEITAPEDEFGNYTIDRGEPFGPEAPHWSYIASPPESFYSWAISGADRTIDGTTVICDGRSGRLFEVTPGGGVVWEYINPVGASGVAFQGDPTDGTNHIFKVRRYPLDYPGFAGRDLTPGDPIEGFESPFPTTDGSLRASRQSTDGESLTVDWNASTCTSFDFNLLYGDLGSVASLSPTGADCGIGVSGSHTWNDVPNGSLYFLVVGTDSTGVYESHWGRASTGTLRGGSAASFHCGTTTRILGASCP